jgi:hypothetical protein
MLDGDMPNVASRANRPLAVALIELQTQLDEAWNLALQTRSIVITLATLICTNRSLRRASLTSHQIKLLARFSCSLTSMKELLVAACR